MTDQPIRTPSRSLAAWLCLLVPLALGLSADLVVKHWSFEALVTDQWTTPAQRVELASREIELIPGTLHLRAHLNYGAVFGLGDGARVLFIVVSILAMALLGYLFRRSGRQRFYQVLLGMLFAGVLGNLYDRAVFGYVRDMIYAFPGWRWSDLLAALPDTQVFPWIFNIADSLLCTGVAGMFAYTMLRRDDPMRAPPERSAAESAASERS